LAAKRRVNDKPVFSRRGTGGIVPLKAYGRPGTFGCAVAEKLAETGLTEAEYVQIAQKFGTSQNRLKAYVEYFKEQGFNIVLENGRYVEKAESLKFPGSSTQNQTLETVLGNQFLNPVEVNVNIDDKFLKDLKVAVKPECIIDDSIWWDWFNTFKGTHVYEKKVHQVAKSKKMVWPTSKSDETFGYYLAMQFSRVKSVLGWDAKRTLLLCIAEEYQAFKSNNNTIVNATINEIPHSEIATNVEDPVSTITRLHDATGTERIELTCTIALEVINELILNNKINYDLINILNDHVVRISKENSMLLENKTSTKNNTLHMKQLLDDMIKMSQDQIIDIDDLSKENKRLMSELDEYKSKYYELKTRYDKAKLSNFGIDRFAVDSKTEDSAANVKLAAPSNIRQSPNNQRQINVYQQDSPVEVVHVQPRFSYESNDDIKI